MNAECEKTIDVCVVVGRRLCFDPKSWKTHTRTRIRFYARTHTHARAHARAHTLTQLHTHAHALTGTYTNIHPHTTTP